MEERVEARMEARVEAMVEERVEARMEARVEARVEVRVEPESEDQKTQEIIRTEVIYEDSCGFYKVTETRVTPVGCPSSSKTCNVTSPATNNE